MRKVKFLLEALTERMCPGEGQSHNITLHNGKLRVCLMLSEGHVFFYLQDDDMDTPVGDLVREIQQLLDTVESGFPKGAIVTCEL